MYEFLECTSWKKEYIYWRFSGLSKHKYIKNILWMLNAERIQSFNVQFCLPAFGQKSDLFKNTREFTFFEWNMYPY